MAIEIFISYRRDNAAGHARNLHAKLAQGFDADRIFFDHDAIQPGDHFADVIVKAVHDCQVLLALVAPDWALPDRNGRRRLHEPEDFVRREIALALSLGKKVVPVLLEGAAIPDASTLPPELVPLFALDVHRIDGKVAQFDHGVALLAEWIARQPGISPPRRGNAGASAAPRPALALLCDRSPQNTAALDAIRAELAAARRRPIVLVVHGRSNEAHHEFVQRLEGHSVPRLLNNRPARFAVLADRLDLDGDLASFGMRLRQGVCDRLQIPEVPDDRALLAALRPLRCSALVIAVTWLASEMGGDPMRPMQRVFDHFAAFPDLPEGLILGCVVCLKYDAAPASGGFLKRLFGGGGDRDAALRSAVEGSAQRFGADARVSWHVARELPSVTFADLDRWKTDVREIDRGFDVPEERLREIVGDEARPMEHVVRELKKLVALT